MDRQELFPIFAAAFVLTGIAGMFFDRKASPATKKRVTPYLMIGGPAVFLAIAAFMAGVTPFFLVVAPLFMALVFVVARATRICDRCGTTNGPAGLQVPRFCRQCGASL